MMDTSIEVFDRLIMDYDQWFETNPHAYQSELAAVRRFLPKASKGIEIGAGTGRFCTAIGIPVGVEPAPRMATLARRRGAHIVNAMAACLPFRDEAFGFALWVNLLCFLDDPDTAFRETRRILRPNGHIILAMIDRASPLGADYECRKEASRFYRLAHLYSTVEATDFLKRADFKVTGYCQTIFSMPTALVKQDPVLDGYGKGVFVVIGACKTNNV